MNRDEMLEKLMEEEGLSEQEAEERILDYEQEEEHLAYFRFMEIHDQNR